jgi:hypothetical protein
MRTERAEEAVPRDWAEEHSNPMVETKQRAEAMHRSLTRRPFEETVARWLLVVPGANVQSLGGDAAATAATVVATFEDAKAVENQSTVLRTRPTARTLLPSSWTVLSMLMLTSVSVLKAREGLTAVEKLHSLRLFLTLPFFRAQVAQYFEGLHRGIFYFESRY